MKYFPVSELFRCSGSVYLFRLVAVYSNNDNKHGRNSDRFFLSSSSVARPRGPSSAPVIVDVQAVSDSLISVHWQVGLYFKAIDRLLQVIQHLLVGEADPVKHCGQTPWGFWEREFRTFCTGSV